MDSLTIAASSGLRSRTESLDLLANNLANSATSGYKSDREFYGLFTSGDFNPVPGEPNTTLPVIEKQWTDFSSGEVQSTGNPLDVALGGKGFFVVNGPSGDLFTRNGSLKVLPTGDLASADGFPLQGVGGGKIQLSPGRQFDITPDGFVHQDGRTLGQLQVVDFKSTQSLRKMGATSFQNTDTANAPSAATGVDVLQGRLESSNVSVAEASMRLVGVMRQFEMLQKAIGISGEMNNKAIQEVAKVTA